MYRFQMELTKRLHSLKSCYLKNQRRLQSIQSLANIKIGNSDLSEDFLAAVERNAILRKHENNIPTIRRLNAELRQATDSCLQQSLREKIYKELQKLPNNTHTRILNYGDGPKEIERYDSTHPVVDNCLEFSEICKRLRLLRMDHLGNFSGHKSYYLMGYLAEMEQAIVQFAVTTLKCNKFELMSVPDILPAGIIEGCGMRTTGERTQVYKLDSGHCLSGTSEMALAGYFKDCTFEESQLPLKLAAVSRCYRAETSGLQEEKGIYRVHQFTKVEMFSICTAAQSEEILTEIKDMEVKMFKDLNLTFKVLDMPPSELGTPAHQKYDIETWLPGRKMWGEISSCSSCTDYQAQRLNIRYRDGAGNEKFVHTINGTAAAVPRLLIALVESKQNEFGDILLPPSLACAMKTKKTKSKLPEIKLIKSIVAPI